MWYRVIYCIYVCLHTARICIFACMHVLVDHGMITCGIISWSCLYGFLLVDANAVVVLLVIDPGAIWEKQQGHVERTWRTIWQVTQTQFPPPSPKPWTGKLTQMKHDAVNAHLDDFPRNWMNRVGIHTKLAVAKRSSWKCLKHIYIWNREEERIQLCSLGQFR